MSIDKYIWDNGETSEEVTHDELIVRMKRSLETSGVSAEDFAEDVAFMEVVSTAVKHNDMEMKAPVVGKVATFFFAKNK